MCSDEGQEAQVLDRAGTARSRLLRASLPVALAGLAAVTAVLLWSTSQAAAMVAAAAAALAVWNTLTSLRARKRFDLIDEAETPLVVSDGRGTWIEVNAAFAHLLGTTRAALRGARERDWRVADAAVAEVRENAAPAPDSGREGRYRRTDGHIVHLAFEGSVTPAATAVADGVRRLLVVQDLTARRAAEAAAAEHRRIRDFHFEHTPLAVIEITADLRIRRWSGRAERVFGWSESEAVGRSLEDLALIPAEQVEPQRARVARMFRGDQDQLSAIIPMLHRSGRGLWMEVFNSIVRDAQLQPQSLITMALDITESQEMLRMLNEGEARFRSIFHQAAVGIALLDERGHWLNVNQRLCEITGYTLDELMEVDFQSITHPDDLERDLHLSRAIMDRTLDHYSMEKRYVRKDGSTCWVMLFVRRIEATTETPARFISVVEDISERKAAEERVRILTAGLESQVAERTGQLREMIRAGQRRNEELSLVTEMSGLLAAATDLGEATQVVVRYLPRVFPQAEGALYLEGSTAGTYERRLHWGPGGAGWASFADADCWALRRGEMHRSEGEPDALCCPHVASDSLHHPHLCVPIHVLGKGTGLIELGWGRLADGWAPELALVKTVADKIGLTLGNLRLREELSRQALIDPLTGLNNRRWLEKALRRRVADHARSGEGFSVLLIDIDHFKTINDRFGHEAGDLALQEMAGVLNRSTRAGEPPARLGGEEFVLLIGSALPEAAMAAAERIRSAIASLRVLTRAGALPPITASVGIAMFPHHGVDDRTVLACADAALYEAKRSGRDQARLHDPNTPVALPTPDSGAAALLTA